VDTLIYQQGLPKKGNKIIYFLMSVRICSQIRLLISGSDLRASPTDQSATRFGGVRLAANTYCP
jgi:hypothetical protein